MVEGNGLENRRARKGTVGSNPTLSATFASPRYSGKMYEAFRVKENQLDRMCPILSAR